MENHKVVDISQKTTMRSRLPFCPKHASDPLYCNDCGKVVCVKCHWSEQSSHQLCLLESQVDKVLRSLSSSIVEDLQKELKTLTETLKKEKQRAEEILQVVENHIKTVERIEINIKGRQRGFEELRSQVDECQLLNSEFQKHLENEKKNFEERLKEERKKIDLRKIDECSRSYLVVWHQGGYKYQLFNDEAGAFHFSKGISSDWAHCVFEVRSGCKLLHDYGVPECRKKIKEWATQHYHGLELRDKEVSSPNL